MPRLGIERRVETAINDASRLWVAAQRDVLRRESLPGRSCSTGPRRGGRSWEESATGMWYGRARPPGVNTRGAATKSATRKGSCPSRVATPVRRARLPGRGASEHRRRPRRARPRITTNLKDQDQRRGRSCSTGNGQCKSISIRWKSGEFERRFSVGATIDPRRDRSITRAAQPGANPPEISSDAGIALGRSVSFRGRMIGHELLIDHQLRAQPPDMRQEEPD